MKQLHPWGSFRGSESNRFTYVPKEALPQPVDDTGKEKPVGWGINPKWVIAAAIVALAFGAYLLFKPKPDPSKVYAQVCVNNLSYQRLPDPKCNPGGDAARWWWVAPNVKVPAVGDYVDETKGSFTKPADDEATVDEGIPVNGRDVLKKS